MITRYLRGVSRYVYRQGGGGVSRSRPLSKGIGTWFARISLLGISLLLGGWLATARAAVPPTVTAQVLPPVEVQQSPQRSWETLPAIGTVDPTPASYRLGEELYLDTCKGCHVAVPPAVLPTETWRQLLQDSQHYGQQLTPLIGPARLLVWNYLLLSSRPHAADESIPFRVQESRYFRALHPDVPLQRPITLAGCVTCHPGAPQYDYRRLTANWTSR